MALRDRLTALARASARTRPPSGTIVYHLVATPDELESIDALPPELRALLAAHPEVKKQIAATLCTGVSLAVRSQAQTPAEVLHAVRVISTESQHRLVRPWLRPLLYSGTRPVFTADDRERAARDGVDLDHEVNVIDASRMRLKAFVWVDDRGRGVSPDAQALLDRLNGDIAQIAVDFAVNRLEFDNAVERTEIAQTIIKARLFIGPIAHVVEHFARGLGKVIAASTDDVMSEVAELAALHGSGFTMRQLVRRSRILIPVFLLATWGAFSVEHFIERNDLVTAGFLFGASAVALSLTTALQSVRMYKQCVDDACRDGKLAIASNRERWRVGLEQDFSNPARLGLFIGAVASPLAAITVFSVFPHWTHNGWVLALLGTTETVVAGTTVILSARINDHRYVRRVRRALGS